MPTLKQLRYFNALARCGHFGRAAEACSVTQPALSMQIKALEEELGTPLFERLPEGARLTGAGAEIAGRAAAILTDMHDLADLAQSRAGALTGPLNLGVIPSVAPYLLPPLLPALRADFPALQLSIRETQTDTLLRELSDGTLDLLLLALPIDQSEIETLPLFQDPFILAVPKDFDTGKNLRLPAELIRHERLLLLEEGHCFRDQALAYCQLREVGQVDTFGASTLTTVVQMVAGGLGITFLPQMAVPVESRNPDVRLVALEAPAPFRDIGLAWRRSSPRKAEFRAFGKSVLAAHDAAVK